MRANEQLLIEVWQEACRHLEIAESCARFRKALARHLPVEQLLIFGLNAEEDVLDSLAASPQVKRQGSGQRVLTPDETAILLAWAENGSPAVWHGSAPPPEARLLLDRLSRSGVWLAVPVTASERTGFVALRGRAGHAFGPAHETMVRALREPFAAALRNDFRLRELQDLRKAAEAERSAALRRLGRERIGGEIVGAQGGLRTVMRRVKQVAKADVPVLIIGETGAGKEVIARAVHEHSHRVQGPFVRVNSGAIPPELIDSELFGHEKGAFTGADTRRHGWFERADGGTLLLDEIGELSLPAQVRLLRALQDGEIRRVGGHKVVHVNVRVIAATHRDLPGMVQAGTFREDLWYRLNTFPLVLPPLRERKDDLPALVAHFCERAARRFGVRVLYPDPSGLAALTAYAWPGNIRELASVIDRAVILGEGKRLEIERALGGMAPSPAADTVRDANAPAAQTAPATPGAVLPLDAALRAHIESVLQATHGRIDGPFGAARVLQVNPHTLRAKMRKLGIDRKAFVLAPEHRRTSP